MLFIISGYSDQVLIHRFLEVCQGTFEPDFDPPWQPSPGFKNMSFKLSSKEGRFDIINGRLCQIEQQIQQNLTDRSSLLRQLNDLRCPCSTLPDEVLSLIFVRACEHPSKSISPIVLGSVCFRWRRVPWDTPSLWSSIGPIPCRPFKCPEVEMLRLYFQNAAQHPIHLSLCPDNLPPEHQDTVDFLRFIFQENPLKIHHLSLCSIKTSSNWLVLEQAIKCSSLPNLSTVSFVSRKASIISSHSLILAHLFHSAISLRALTFDSYRLPHFAQISASLITVLHFREISTSQCLRYLSHCLGLVEFHCHLTRPSRKGIESLDHSIKELQNLEIFDVNLDRTLPFNGSSPWTSFLWTYFRFPNLKHMMWGTLAIQLEQDQAASFFEAMQSLITFKCTAYYVGDDLIRLLQVLSPTVRTVYLPRLSYHRETSFSILKHILSNVVVPGSKGMRHLELAFPENYGPVLDAEIFDILQNLREAGVGLEISTFDP